MSAAATEPMSPAPTLTRVPTVRRLAPFEPPLDPVCDWAEHEHPSLVTEPVGGHRHLHLVPPETEPLPFDDPAPAPRPIARPATASRVAGFFERQPTRSADLPDPERFGRVLIRALIEVLAGRRSITQVQPMLSPAVFHGVSQRVASRRSWPLARPAPARRGGPAVPASPLRSVHVTTPADGIVELAAVVRHGARYRAVAARLEGLDGRWRCVQLQIG